ncbi:ATP-binding protein [Spongiivirga citrea]|uniref:Tetratricopeptide repeat protein n=1 Tax=Spongiivirga citrea TaxID=1481457 RepID=A0A6M0CI83_9FLAO|nr:sensor histidine kinase [Spongiivirga citrea]NER17676.1 tetratricopeptide repeat protein [Spongiivirga citrea]
MIVKPVFKTLWVSFFLFLNVNFLHAQNKQIVDSLKQLIQQEKVEDTIKVKAYNDLGIQFGRSNPKLAKQYINNALSLAIRADAKRGVAGAYNCLGIVDYYQKDYDEALINFQKALEINEELGHAWGQASALNQIGAVQNLKDDYTAAILSFEKAGDIFKTMKDSLAWAKSIQNIGVSYSRMAHHKKSIEYYLTAAELYKAINNPAGTAAVYISLSNILYKQGDHNKSLDYLNEAFPIVKNIDNTDLLSIISRKKGSNYSRLKDYDKALDYFQVALEYHKNNKNKKKIRPIQFQLGNTYYEIKDYTKALEYQKEALQNYDLNSNFKDRAKIHNAISKTYIKRNEYSEATDYATNALKISQTIEYLEGQKDANQTLAIIAQEQGEIEKALQFYMDFQKLNDSLSVQENQQQVRELTTIYKTEQNEAQIASQKKNITLLDTQNKLKTQLLWFGGAGFLAVFGFILVFKSRQKAKRDIKQQEYFTQGLIEAQENERTRVSKDLHDSVGQQLTFIKKKAQNLDQTELSVLANTALEEVRSISRDLYPATLKQLGLAASIEQLLFDLDGESDMFFSVEVEDINQNFNETETLNFYRFIQESVNNVLKHANAKTIIVNIVKQQKNIEVLIKDNGRGFQTTKEVLQNSLGLKTMAERVRILKGHLSIQSKKEVGTTILVKIPV